ncbi:MAG: glycosyltransferase [Candidatus Pacebacteria bacterium]|nr:glycosyltransferase [Candidatus Paceibacterota bacterium]
MTKPKDDHLHNQFVGSNRPHVLMITNHGIHQWEFIPGLPDTGGQNVFVNQFTSKLADLGFKITIVNRGGYEHPTTGEMHRGIDYYDKHQRILYLEDGDETFIRKEDMDSQTPKLAKFLVTQIKDEGIPVDLILSHYWDSAKVGILFNNARGEHIKHIWTPHSLGAIKKRNMPPDTWDDLRIDERIENEKWIVPQLEGVAATSSLIRESLKNDYGSDEPYFLPPCVKTDRFFYRDVGADHDVWDFLSETTGLPKDDCQAAKIVTEISRTDKTKRKDVLIKAFAKVHEKLPQTLLVIAIDKTEKELAQGLFDLIDDLDLNNHVAAIGNEWERLPFLYSVTDIYCSPSVMEGFGMAVQEAAATRVPVVGSNRIPFVEEYLLGDDVEEQAFDDMTSGPLRIGEGGIVVPADDVAGFAHALETLLTDETLRRKTGECAYHITVPYFTWDDMTRRFLREAHVSLPL